MNLTSILGFLSLAGWIMLLAGAGIAISNAAQNRPTRGGIGLALLGLIIGVLFFMMSSGLVQVGATEVAVVFQAIGGNPDQGNLWETPLGPGVHVIMPIVNQPIIYSTEIRSYTMSRVASEGAIRGEDAVEARTADGQAVNLDISVLYGIDPLLANIVHRKWQSRFEDGFIRPTVRSAVREAIASYTVNDLYGGTGFQGDEQRPSQLPKVQQDLNTALSKDFQANGLILQNLLLREITFSEEFIRAVEAKQVAEQQAEQAKQEAERARTIAKGEADANVTRAEGEAKANEARARGEAAAIRLRAEAEAAALDLINAQISKNPALIQWRYIENLSDQVSLILVPTNSPFLFDLGQLSGQNGTPGTPVNK